MEPLPPPPSSSVITALKGRTQVRFQPSPPDTNVMALPSSPSSSSSFAMTSTWQQRLPSWSTSAAAPQEEEREGERAFRPPERTESQKYDAWKDIFQRAEHYQNNFRKVTGKLQEFTSAMPYLTIKAFDFIVPINFSPEVLIVSP